MTNSRHPTEPGSDGAPDGALDPAAAERILASVSNALGLYFRDASPKELFGALLDDLLALTGSEYGYIAEVVEPDGGDPFLRTWAITDISWDDTTRALYQQHVTEGGGLEFTNLDTLFGYGLRTGDVVIANEPWADPRAGGRPGAHPPLDAFLAVPVRRGSRMIGQLGVANRPGGYDMEVVERLAPFTAAVANLIDAYRNNAERLAAQRALARSERTLGAIVSNLSDIVTILEPDGSWRYSSPTGSRVLGYPRGYDPEGGVFSLLHPDDVAPALSALAEVLAATRGADEPIDLRIRTVDGEYRVFETVGVNLVNDPAICGVVLTSHDVTASRMLERQRTQMLESERSMRLAIEEQNRSLRELATLKNEFVASVSHELRTPITAIMGFAELLQEDAAAFPEEDQEFLGYIETNAQRLLRLVNDLLTVGRLEAGVVTLERDTLCASDLVEEAVASLRSRAVEASVAIVVEHGDGPHLWADRDRIGQVLDNLLGNAVKFTPQGGTIRARALRCAAAWCFEVSDTGIGIPAAEQDRLFHRFFRASNTASEQTPGTGLGLVITRAIVELHGGTIEVESTEGEGTTVRIVLPDVVDGPTTDSGSDDLEIAA